MRIARVLLEDVRTERDTVWVGVWFDTTSESATLQGQIDYAGKIKRVTRLPDSLQPDEAGKIIEFAAASIEYHLYDNGPLEYTA